MDENINGSTDALPECFDSATSVLCKVDSIEIMDGCRGMRSAAPSPETQKEAGQDVRRG
jgi:hypothetical protein